MKSRPTTTRPPGARSRARAGFTLVEVLAALVFMGIVIPVALEAVRVAGLAGEVAERKVAAARIADRILNELIVTDGLRQASATGVAEEGMRRYEWSMRTETWTVASLNLVTLNVVFNARGKEYDVNLTTLFDPETLSTSGLSTSTAGSTR